MLIKVPPIFGNFLFITFVAWYWNSNIIGTCFTLHKNDEINSNVEPFFFLFSSIMGKCDNDEWTQLLWWKRSIYFALTTASWTQSPLDFDKVNISAGNRRAHYLSSQVSSAQVSPALLVIMASVSTHGRACTVDVPPILTWGNRTRTVTQLFNRDMGSERWPAAAQLVPGTASRTGCRERAH